MPIYKFTMEVELEQKPQPLVSLGSAVEMYKLEFCTRYPESKFLIDGEGYEDEDLDLSIYIAGDEVESGKYAAEVSYLVQERTGYFILPFMFPPEAYPLSE